MSGHCIANGSWDRRHLNTAVDLLLLPISSSLSGINHSKSVSVYLVIWASVHLGILANSARDVTGTSNNKKRSSAQWIQKNELPLQLVFILAVEITQDTESIFWVRFLWSMPQVSWLDFDAKVTKVDLKFGRGMSSLGQNFFNLKLCIF